jgi:hypothetical protein
MARLWLSLILLAGCPAVKTPQAAAVPPAPEVPATPLVPSAPAVPDVVPSAPAVPDMVPPADEPTPETSEAAVKVQTGTVQLLPFSAKKLTIVVGTRVEYGFSVHGSVGKGSSATSGPDDVLPLVSREATYNQPEKMKAGMTGGDSQSGTYVWVAKAPGEAWISVQESFRGQVKGTYDFVFTVVALAE